jgi:predicted secreted Zn-dependent protease
MMQYLREVFAVHSKIFVVFYLALGLFGLAGSPASAFDALTVHRSFEPYDVSGTTMEAVRQSLFEGQPPESRGFISITNYLIQYDYSWIPTVENGEVTSCSIKGTVIVDTVVKLPRHVDPDSLPADVRAIWDRFAAATERHEMQHVEDTVEVASSLSTQLNAITAPDCDQAAQQAEAVAQEMVPQARQRADAYDARTNHGINDGAIFE